MRNVVISLSFILVLLPSLGALHLCAEERPVIHESDVVFMYAGNAAKYEAFHGTVVGWGGRPRSRDTDAVEQHKKRIAEAKRSGMRYCASVDFLVDFAGFIDFRPETFLEAACVDLERNPLRVPWLWDHKHKGHPAYWFCTNNPEVRLYLLDQTERACLAPIDGLHIDDYSGTSACSAYNGGCFCQHCMEGFRKYLKERFDSAWLREQDVENSGTFHYGEFLRVRGFNAQTYKSRHGQCTLISEFQDFQNEGMKRTITEMFQHAEKLRGKPLLRSINSSASSPRTLVPAPTIDYFCGEVPAHVSTERVSPDPVFVYRIVEALQRKQTATASGQDWAWIRANEKPGLVRCWIAQAYAFGSVFMAPHNQWCYTKDLGTHWWHGQPKDFGAIYRFVRNHAALLDGYKTLAKVGLVYSTGDYVRIRDTAHKLIEANVPFRLLFPGDRFSEESLYREALAACDVVLVADKAVELEGKRLVHLREKKELPEPIVNTVTVEGSDSIRVSLRGKPGDPSAPLVCHVLNQEYDAKTDRVLPVNIEIAFSKALLKQTGVRELPERGMAHSPGNESQAVAVTETDSNVSIHIQDAGLWTVVEF